MVRMFGQRATFDFPAGGNRASFPSPVNIFGIGGCEVRGVGRPDKGEGTKEKDPLPPVYSEQREANSKTGMGYGV